MHDLALPTFNELALCSGAGGLSLGLKLAIPSIRTVAHVERESYAAAALVARMADEAMDPAPVWDDLATFDGRPWRGVVDLVSAGYPCQPFSAAGKRLGTKDPRHLWPHVRRIINEVRPEWVFLENVEGHLSLGYRLVRCQLERLGFRVAEGLFSASEVGAPHQRKRLFVLANRGRGVCLADPPGQRRQGERVPEGPRPEGQGAPNADRASHLMGVALGNAHSSGLEGRRLRGGRCADQRPTRPPSLPLFPPFRDDFDGWRAVLEIDPALKPALCRVANRMAHRVDRLRLPGNGVVPLAAANAFATLYYRHFSGGTNA